MKFGEPVEGAKETSANLPDWISHYLVEDILGEGTFGRVLLALDTQLDRKVAVKLLEKTSEDISWALSFANSEARVAARLDHPNIVPVFNVGQTADDIHFIVTKYIDGQSLAEVLTQNKLDRSTLLGILATIARAVHYLHVSGVVHRDLKPENVMIDKKGRPFLIDFGSVLNAQSPSRVAWVRTGTFPYMSPEQAGGDCEILSGRSDVFALGVMLYELLSGETPCEPDVGRNGLLDYGKFINPSRFSGSAPSDLKRLCLDSLAVSPFDRPDALTFAERLESNELLSDNSRVQAKHLFESRRLLPFPKGFQCFNEEDSESFVNLLPGPIDANGLPQCVSVWKNRIENTDWRQAFKVGLIYGKSGSGKSSLIRSGILPRLSVSITTVFVEADSNIEENLRTELLHRFPELNDESDLVRVFERIQAGEVTPLGSKLVIIIDQFEQHLQCERNSHNSLLRCLKQCNGVRLAVLLVVRDDFWVGASKFFSELSINIDTGRNAGVVNFFDEDHAMHVLTRFGQSLDRLPASLQKKHKKFIRIAVSEMSDGTYVSPILIALFVEVFRSRSWELGELQKFGGISGLGAHFLEESFSERFSAEQHIRAVEGAHKILRLLLPRRGAKIKGEGLTREEIRKAASFSEHCREFEQLLYILIRELKLISPVSASFEPFERKYRLAHDFLISIVREWIDGEKSHTRKGRAELLLRDRADAWRGGSMAPPTLTPREWYLIRISSRKSSWTFREAEMMARGARREFTRMCLIISVLFLAVFTLHKWKLEKTFDALLTTVEEGPLWEIPKQNHEMEKAGEAFKTALFASIRNEGTPPQMAFNSSYALYILGELEHTTFVKKLFALPLEEFKRVCSELEGFDDDCLRYAETLTDGGVHEDAFKAKALLVLNGQAEYLDELVEEWLDKEIEEVLAWAEIVLSLGKEVDELARRRYEIPPDYDPGYDYGFEVSAEKSAKVAVAYAATGDLTMVRESLSTMRRVEQRSHVISYFKPTLVKDYRFWTDEKEFKGNLNLISGLLQAIAEESWDDIAIEMRPFILENVMKALRSSKAQVHHSAAFAMRRWNLLIPEVEPAAEQDEGDWIQSETGIPLVVLPEIEGRITAISAMEVSQSRFFDHVVPKAPYAERSRLQYHEDLPMLLANPQEVMKFCNLLSKKESLEPCYVEQEGTFFPRADVKGYSGYRIPTLLEWRTAYEAGRGSKFFFGNTTQSLLAHAWIDENTDERPRRVGTRRPNQLGLFDMLGNSSEWVADEMEGNQLSLSIVGGGFDTQIKEFSNGFPERKFNEGQSQPVGIRLVRTLSSRNER